MTAINYYLLKNPHTFTKLLQEVEDAVACRQISNPLTYFEAEKLRYLAAVMKEAMRCLPFLTLLLERAVPSGGTTIARTWPPGGTVVGCHPTVVHHDHDCFGEDADVFRAERWPADDTERVIAMERVSLRFGSWEKSVHGPAYCGTRDKEGDPWFAAGFKASGSTRASIKRRRRCTNTKVKLILKDPSITLEPADNFTSFPKTILVTFEEIS